MITNLLSEEIAKKFKLNANFDDEEFKRLARKEDLRFSGDMSKTVRRIRDAVHFHNDDVFNNHYMGIKFILDEPENIKRNLLWRLEEAKEQHDEKGIKKIEEDLILKDYFTKVAKLEGKAVRELLEEKTKLKLEKESEPKTQEEPKQEELIQGEPITQEEQKTEVKEMNPEQEPELAQKIHEEVKKFTEQITKENRKAEPEQKLANFIALNKKVEESIKLLKQHQSNTIAFKKAKRYLMDKWGELGFKIEVLSREFRDFGKEFRAEIVKPILEEQQKPKIEEPKKEEPKQINKDVFNEEDIQKYNLKPNISREERAQILENDIKEFNRASTMTPERKEFLKWEIQRLLIECNITIGEDRYYELRQRFIRIAKQKYNEEINYNRTEIQKMNLLSIFEKKGLKIKNDFDLDLLREIRVIENFEKGLGKEVKIIEKIPQKTILMLPAPNQERTAQKIESINNCKQIIEDCFKEIRELPIENQNIDHEDWRIIRAVNLEKKPLEQIPEVIEIFRNACNSENIEEQNKIFDQLLKIFEDNYEKIRQPFSKKLRIFKRAFLKMLQILDISKSNRICLKKHIFIDTSKIQNNACLTNIQEVIKEKIQNTEIEENKGFKTGLQVINNITRIQENPKQPDKIKHTFKLLRTLRNENKKVAKTMKKTLRYILREATKKRTIKGV